MSNPENKIDNTFNRVMEELNRLEKAFQPGKGLEKAIMSIGGDPSYLKDVAEAMSSAYEALEQAHYGAIAHLDNVDEALSKKKRITNKTPVGMVAEGVLDGADEDGFMARSQLYFLARDAITMHAQIKDQDDLEPWVQTKIAQSSKDMDAVRRYTEYSSMEQDVEPQMSPDMGDQNLPAVVPGEEVETELRPLNASAESISKSEYGLISYPDTSISYIRKTDEGNWEHIFDKSYGYEGVVDNADLKYARPIPLGKIPERMHDEALQEDWESMQPIDRDRYQEREGLEGPFMTRIGKVVYYDPKEGSYYDPDQDIFITYEDWKEMDLPNAPLRNEMSKRPSYTPAREPEPSQPEPKDPPKMQVTPADKNANTPAWQRYKSGDSRYVYKGASIAEEVTESKKDEKFKPHMMYDPKTGKGKMCKVEKDHKDLAKKGWTHDKPKAKDIKEGMAFDEKRTDELQVVAKDMFKNALANAKKKAGK